jgi:hypothetical protein
LPEEQAIRTKPKFGRKTYYEQKIEYFFATYYRSSPDTAHADKRTVRVLPHAIECKTNVDISQ